jgi:hypothetical protein
MSIRTGADVRPDAKAVEARAALADTRTLM